MKTDYKVYSVDTKVEMYQHIIHMANAYAWQAWSVHAIDDVYAVTYTRKIGSAKLHGISFYVVEEEKSNDEESIDILGEQGDSSL